MLNIGILGCGRIGQVHAGSLQRIDTARVAAVADAFPDTATALAARTGASVMSVDEIIASPDIDAVVIGTPTDTHFDLIQKSAKAGKAIFCEKPVDMSSERIRECIEVVEAAGVPFLTGFNRRFDPGFAAIRARIAAGEIGDVELVTILSRDPSPPPVSYIKSSGGLFRDMMIHDFDMARFLLGEEVVRVFATGSALVDPAIGEAGDVDTAVAVLTTASGRICQISNSRRATYGYDQRAEVHGSLGLIKANNVPENNVEIASAAGFRSAPAQHFFLERYAGAYLAEMKHFIDCLTAGTAPSPGIRDGLAAQMIADAAARSLATGVPVDLG
jgi:myo-inositol 2-dehydrogenase / D-chiro-inositol 1-dehydrogenase